MLKSNFKTSSLTQKSYCCIYTYKLNPNNLIRLNYFVSIFIFKRPMYWYICIFSKEEEFSLLRCTGVSRTKDSRRHFSCLSSRDLSPGCRSWGLHICRTSLSKWRSQAGLCRLCPSPGYLQGGITGAEVQPALCQATAPQGCATAWTKGTCTSCSAQRACTFLTGTATRASFYS